MPGAAIKVEQTVQEWGNSLAVRLTSRVARAANLARGTPVTVEVVEEGVLLRVVGQPRLSLAEKLEAFDPVRHGGEAMGAGRTGAELF